jgi:hypothetical protein
LRHDVRSRLRGVVAAQRHEPLPAREAEVGLGRRELVPVGGRLDAFGIDLDDIARQIASAGFV